MQPEQEKRKAEADQREPEVTWWIWLLISLGIASFAIVLSFGAWVLYQMLIQVWK